MPLPTRNGENSQFYGQWTVEDSQNGTCAKKFTDKEFYQLGFQDWPWKYRGVCHLKMFTITNYHYNIAGAHTGTPGLHGIWTFQILSSSLWMVSGSHKFISMWMLTTVLTLDIPSPSIISPPSVLHEFAVKVYLSPIYAPLAIYRKNLIGTEKLCNSDAPYQPIYSLAIAHNGLRS